MEVTNEHKELFKDIRDAEKRATELAEKSKPGLEFGRNRDQVFMERYIEYKDQHYADVRKKHGVDEDFMFQVIEHGVKKNWHMITELNA